MGIIYWKFLMELDRSKLKAAEREFLRRFPEGFLDPEMQAIGKKHSMNKMVGMALTFKTYRSISSHLAIINISPVCKGNWAD